MKMKYLIKIFIGVFVFMMTNLAELNAADQGDCGQNCWYTYKDGTITFSVKDENNPTPAIISKTITNYSLSGSIKDVIINEGITEVYQNGSADYIIQSIGTPGGKLVIPSTMTSFGDRSTFSLPFDTVEINSKNMSFGISGLAFTTNATPTIVMQADANITFDSQLQYVPGQGKWFLPASINIACKGNPDICLSKFGNSLNNMDKTAIHADYYSEMDSNQNITLQYFDDGYGVLNAQGFYDIYDFNDQFIEYSNLARTEIYDQSGTLLEKHDSNGNLLNSYSHHPDGSVSIFDSNGKLIGITGKRIFTVDEATALVSGKGNNTFILKYR